MTEIEYVIASNNTLIKQIHTMLSKVMEGDDFGVDEEKYNNAMSAILSINKDVEKKLVIKDE